MAVALLDRHAGLTARAGLVAAVAGANAVIFGAFAFQRVRELLAVAVGLPLLVALLRRPQRGILVLVVGAPLTGLLLLVPHPAILDGWKQIVVGVMLVGTFIAPSENRGPTDRQLPSWVVGLAPLLVLGAVSGVAVGGLRAFYGLRAYFFYLLAAWAVWRCPPNRKERDRVVTALMICGLLEALYALIQQYLGPERLN